MGVIGKLVTLGLGTCFALPAIGAVALVVGVAITSVVGGRRANQSLGTLDVSVSYPFGIIRATQDVQPGDHLCVVATQQETTGWSSSWKYDFALVAPNNQPMPTEGSRPMLHNIPATASVGAVCVVLPENAPVGTYMARATVHDSFGSGSRTVESHFKVGPPTVSFLGSFAVLHDHTPYSGKPFQQYCLGRLELGLDDLEFSSDEGHHFEVPYEQLTGATRSFSSDLQEAFTITWGGVYTEHVQYFVLLDNQPPDQLLTELARHGRVHKAR
jgi:hypothetical protein